MFSSQPSASQLPTRYFHREPNTPPEWCYECDEEDGDYRIYELRYGAKVYLNFFAITFYTNGKIASEGVLLGGYKAGIWRHYNSNGLLSSVGRYNKRNERWGKWTMYEELDGEARIYMSCDLRGDRESYSRYDMDGKLWYQQTILNARGDTKDCIYINQLDEPTERLWPDKRY